MRFHFIFILLLARVVSAQPLRVNLQVDATKGMGPWIPAYRFFGYDEANFTYLRDGQRLLGELGELKEGGGGEQVFIRCHHLLTSGDGTPALKWSSTNVYSEDAGGKPVYDWKIVDRIFDTYVRYGLKPYAQIGFMPKALSVRGDLYPAQINPEQRVPVDAGQAYPPKDYGKWRDLVAAWVEHCVRRYGKAEVQSWYWEVWNEPNISYWKGTQEEYFKLYDYAADGVRRVLPTGRVGGPEQAGGGGKFLRAFLQHCIDGANEATGGRGAPLDFISFHAKGSPRFVDGYVQMGISRQLDNIESGFATVAEFPKYRGTPIVIGESDPDGCAACTGPQYGYRVSTQYAAYTAEAFARTLELAAKYRVNLEGALTWAFEFEGKPYFAGYRVLASNGIDLPVLNGIRMMSKLHGERLAVENAGAVELSQIQKSGVRKDSDVYALATRDEHQVAVLMWNYHDDDMPGPEARVNLAVTNIPAKGATETCFAIDETHSNAYTAWKRMGSPPAPSAEQYGELKSAGQLELLKAPKGIEIRGGKFGEVFSVRRESLLLVVLTF